MCDDSLKRLIGHWREFEDELRPFVHRSDKDIIFGVDGCSGEYDGCCFDRLFSITGKKDCFELSLLPVPFDGDIKNANVVFLMLNPGLSHVDYYAENNVPEFRGRLLNTLRQRFLGVNGFKFMSLDPMFCWSGGFLWWEKKLRKVLQVVAKIKCRGDYSESLRFVSGRVACIDFFPYRSKSFSGSSKLLEIESSRLVKDFVEKYVLPDAESKKKCVVVLRANDKWKVPVENQGCVVYSGGECQQASLGEKSKGYKAILSQFGIET